MSRTLILIALLAAAISGVIYLMWPPDDFVRLQAPRRAEFQEAALRAETLIQAIAAHISVVGRPPESLAGLVPDYIDSVPATGLRKCDRFEYRLLPGKQAALAWYDLGSRQGRPWSGKSRYSDGNQEHAILVFTLDREDKISSALIDRAPEDLEPVDFDSTRWKAGQERMQMAPALAETYRLYGMPRSVFEKLLGPPDGRRVLEPAPWELRINCPTRLLNRDVFLYWPTEHYPEHLYGGRTEAVGAWVYVHN